MEPQPDRKTIDIRREAKQCLTCGHRFSGDARFCPFDGAKLEPAKGDPLGDALLGGTIDGRYEVIEILGEGGTGRVYKVRHAALNRLFAMKILRRDLARDAELAARFIQEAKATASVRHPNVIGITDFGTLPDGAPFLVTELLVGRTLGEVMRAECPMRLPRAAHIVKQIAGALGAAHAVGIVHRDLKPDNVFLVGVDDVKVVDFGAAKVVGASRLTRDGIVFGTPHYMSPEQASGQPVDHRSDLYSLGVIMYEMFTGRVPFEADTYMGVLTQHMFVQPVPPSQVTAAGCELGALEEIALVCLAKKPEERYPSMDRLAAEVDRAVRAGPDQPSGLGAPPVDDIMRGSVDSRVSMKWRTRWGWMACSGVFLAVLVGARALARREAAPATESQPRAAVAAPQSVPLDGAAAVEAEPSMGFDQGPAMAAEALSRMPPPASTASVIRSEGLSFPGATAGSSSPSRQSAPNGTHGTVAPARPTSGSTRRQLPPPQATGIDDIGDPFVVRR